MVTVKLNQEQKLYVISGEKYVSCLGFEVCHNRGKKLAEELELNFAAEVGTIDAYYEYQKLVNIAHIKHTETGWKSKSELIPEFIGKEGFRVEVITKYGEKNRFIIGKSTGFIPCHIERKKSNSSGGIAVMGYPFKSIRFIEKVF